MEIETTWKQVEKGLRAYVSAQLGGRPGAEDILQDIFLKMHQNIHQLRDEKKVEYWLFRIAQNAVKDHYRSQKRQQKLVRQEFPMLAGESPSSESAELTQQVAEWLPAMLELLPEKYRQALYLTEIEGLSQKELAEKLQLSYSGAKSRVQRGRAQLKAMVLECCEVATDKYGNVLGYQQRNRQPEAKAEEVEDPCCTD